MMTITKAVTLTGSSQFGENKVAATMYANLQNGNISTNITDKDLYIKNATQVKKDIADFTDQVFAEMEEA